MEEIIIAEKGVNKHNEISLSSANGIQNGQVDFSLRLSDDLDVGEPIEFDIGLKDSSNNISSYQRLEVYLSDDTKYSTTSYSGDSIPDVSGVWDVSTVVAESNPVYPIGTVINNQITISQSGGNITLSDNSGSHHGNIRGEDPMLTITYDGTIDLLSQGKDIYVDFWATFSGELVNSYTIEGESNSIIGSVYGDDADEAQIYSVSADIVMTKDNGTTEVEDDGDTFSTASSIFVGETYSREIENDTDVDYFKFTTSSAGTINIHLSNLSDDLDILLYNDAHNYLDASTNEGTANENINHTVYDSDLFYVKVIGYSGRTGEYDLSVTFTPSGGSGSGLGRVNGYVYREGFNPGAPSSGISGVNVCIGSNCMATGQSSTYTLWDVPVGAQTITANAAGYFCYKNQVLISEGQLVGDSHNIKMIKDNGIEITSGTYIDGDTSSGDKLYYFDTLPGNTSLEISLSVPVYNPSAPDAFDLGVNLPLSECGNGYPTSAASADVSDLRNTPGANIEFTAVSTPAFESGRYYILVEKVNSGGPFRLSVHPGN